MAKKKIIETHGKVAETQPTHLEQVWGFNEHSKYGTTDEKVYESRLNEMTRADFETEARRHGTIIAESTARLKENLLRDFRIYVSLLTKPANRPISKEKPDAAALKVLAEGR
jgi:hypothetical protein